MSQSNPFQPALPEGWFYPDAETVELLHAELQRELPPGHLLTGRAVEVFAWCGGGYDDVLFRHTDEPARFTVIHLSWLGSTEINAQHPTVEFDGTFNEFTAEQERIFDFLRSLAAGR